MGLYSLRHDNSWTWILVLVMLLKKINKPIIIIYNFWQDLLSTNLTSSRSLKEETKFIKEIKLLSYWFWTDNEIDYSVIVEEFYFGQPSCVD